MSQQNGSIKGAISRRGFLGASAALAGGLAASRFGTALAAGYEPQMAGAAAEGALAGLQATGALDEAYWRRVAAQFNVVDEMIYMNNGTLGPMPRTVFDTNVYYLRAIAEDPRETFRDKVEEVRGKLAAFVGADADEVVLTRSTTEGEKIFCAGLDLAQGDEILMSSHEHGGGAGPWRARVERHGITIKEVEIPAPPESVDQIVSLCEAAITPRTRVLLVSHPIYVTGTLMPIQPLAEMAHRHGLLISVDGAHALGMMNLDLHGYGIDHYTTAGQKWLMAGTGTGLSYFRRDVQSRVWADMPFDEGAGAARYERSGQRNVPSILGMGAAVDFQNAIGKQNVESRIHYLAGYLRDGLAEIPNVSIGTSTSPELSGGLTVFYIADVPNTTTARVIMERQGIHIVRSGLNPSACRVSTHIYTQPAQIDHLLEGIRHIAENAANYRETSA